MSTTEAEAGQGSVKFTENPEQWLHDRQAALRADAEEPAAQPEAAEPTVEAAAEVPAEAPEERKTSWRDAVMDDVDDAFFKGKTVAELDKSYRASVAAMQKAQREANVARQELEAIKQQPQPQRAAPAAQPPSPAPEGDPDLEAMIFEDTKAAIALIEQRAEEKARRVFAEEHQRVNEQQQWTALKHNSESAVASAAQKIAERLGLTTTEEVTQRMRAIFGVMQPYEEQYGKAIWMREENYLGIAEQLWGTPQQREAAPSQEAPAPARDDQGRFAAQPVAEIANPPGNRRPAAPASPRRTTPSPLAAEEVEARREIARTMTASGLAFDEDRFIARGAKGESRAK